MKQVIKNILYGVTFCLLVTACDFLELTPPSDLTNENFGSGSKDSATVYTTAQQMEDLLGGAYRHFADEFWQLDMYILNDIQADNGYAGEINDEVAQIEEFRIVATNPRLPDKEWGAIYSHISDANLIIEWTPKIEDPVLTEARRVEIIGEARFMRALCYFNLVRIFGEVPLRTKAISEISLANIDEIYPSLYSEKASLPDIYAVILEDLEYAVNNVSDYSGSYKFKITKAVANLVLALVYTTKDGYESTDWAKVKELTTAIVNDTRYGLMDNFDDLFTIGTTPDPSNIPSANLTNENCKESLFEINYTSWSELGNWSASMFFGIDWKKYSTPSHDLVDAFDRENDNVRKNSSILFGDATGKWTDRFWPSNNYPYCYKQRAQEMANIILFRYAEAVLLLAEAENELGNIDAARTQLNRIRYRAKLPNTTAGSKEAMRLAIENEHRFEFAFEGKRWMDLKRRGRFIQVMQNATDQQKEYAARLNENRLILPIPQQQLDLNENLTQNPGY
ncbi:MAG: RagB/SusD family nutrient uptake outer membrane protein [Prevotellaceae bacterium]|jgi:hypothetical protein|nr:RagB/SusD family nutrient uptake outer membrane protein [Prevotellaceae bacterium]